jgi:transposase-like protein
VPGGRPPKLTPELADTVCGYVRAGNTVKDAIAAVGVDESTFYRWVRNGIERRGSIYGQFRQSIAQAKAEATIVDMETIYRAGQERSQRITTVTKRVLQAGELVVVEETVAVVDCPSDWRAAAKKVEWRNQCRGDGAAGQATEPVPRDIMARTLAEKLRLVQGGAPNDRAASMLRDEDVEARRLLDGG